MKDNYHMFSVQLFKGGGLAGVWKTLQRTEQVYLFKDLSQCEFVLLAVDGLHALELAQDERLRMIESGEWS